MTSYSYAIEYEAAGTIYRLDDCFDRYEEAISGMKNSLDIVMNGYDKLKITHIEFNAETEDVECKEVVSSNCGSE